MFIGGALVSWIRWLRLGLLDAQLTSGESNSARSSDATRHSRRSSRIPDSPPAGPAFIPQITSEIIVIIIAVIFPLPGGELPEREVVGWISRCGFLQSIPATWNVAMEV